MRAQSYTARGVSPSPPSYYSSWDAGEFSKFIIYLVRTTYKVSPVCKGASESRGNNVGLGIGGSLPAEEEEGAVGAALYV